MFLQPFVLIVTTCICFLELRIEDIDTDYKKEKSTGIKVFLISRAKPDIRNAKHFSPRTTDHDLVGPIHWHFCPLLTWAHKKKLQLFLLNSISCDCFFHRSFSYHIISSDRFIIAFRRCIGLNMMTWSDAQCTYLFNACFHNICAHKWHLTLKVFSVI